MNNLPNEEWKDILGYEGIYSVSSLGRIRNVTTDKILKQWEGGNNQLMVTLCADGKKSKVYVSNIVGVCFVGIANRDKNEVYCHLDKNKYNNSVENISIERKSDSHLLNYHLGVQADWGIKNAGVKTQFVPKQLYIGKSIKDGRTRTYTYDELKIKYGTGVRSIFRCLNKEKNFISAYKQNWSTIPLNLP